MANHTGDVRDELYFADSDLSIVRNFNDMLWENFFSSDECPERVKWDYDFICSAFMVMTEKLDSIQESLELIHKGIMKESAKRNESDRANSDKKSSDNT